MVSWFCQGVDHCPITHELKAEYIIRFINEAHLSKL